MQKEVALVNLKKSNYNVEIETLMDGSKLVYNTYSGIFGVMDKETQIVFNNIENHDTNFHSSVCSHTVDSNDEAASRAAKIIDTMFRAGYVVDADKDELATLRFERAKGRHIKNNLSLTIAPTLDCNMACPYCYEDKNKLIMSNETQEKLVAFVKIHFATHPDIKSMSVTWYGGEPLMQKDIIRNLSEKLIDMCTEKNINYSAHIITNGILLDKETAEQLVRECKVTSAQITIDGPKETHNARRILIGDGDSFDIIISNIDACKELLNISIRVNIDKENSGDIEELTGYFLEEKGWSGSPSFYLAPVDNYDESCLISQSKCLQGEEFATFDIECIRAIYAHNRDAVVHRFFSQRKYVFCGGESIMNYVIDPEGNTYNCYVHIGDKKRITGSISKPFMITSEYGKWLLSDIHSRCEQCSFLPMCMGSCMIHKLDNNGEPKCFRTFYTYKDTLKLAYEDYLVQMSKQETSATENNAINTKQE
jgi:uncharacterized protein